MRRTKGFTLVELLVVIAIISLLVSILMPGLAYAKEAARRAACMANLNGIGKALAQYQSHYDDEWPWMNSSGAFHTTRTGVGQTTPPDNSEPQFRGAAGGISHIQLVDRFFRQGLDHCG